jgi:anti-sigma-K factor RskA
MSDAIPEHDRDTALAGEYALGLLDAAERRAFEDRLNTHPALRAELAQWHEQFSTLLADTDEVPPPAGVKSAVMAAIEPQTPAVARFAWLRARSGIGLASGLAGAAAIALAVALYIPRTSFNPGYGFDVTAQQSAFQLRADYDATTGELHLIRETPAPATDQVHEVWMIADAAPVSLGLLAADGRYTRVLPAEIATQLVGSTIAISLEPAGGAPDGVPTGPVLITAVLQIL